MKAQTIFKVIVLLAVLLSQSGISFVATSAQLEQLGIDVISDRVTNIEGNIQVEKTYSYIIEKPEKDSEIVFRDDFNSAFLDSDVWESYPNGGEISLDGNFVSLSTAGSAYSFPYVDTKTNVFPAAGSFSVKLGIQYTGVTSFGTGLHLFDMHIPNGTPGTGMPGSLFSVWQDTNGLIVGTILPTPDINYHEIEFRWRNNINEYYLDNQLVYSVARDPEIARPQSLWFGNPFVPGSYDFWTSFKLDYIEISAIDEPQLFGDDFNDNVRNPSLWNLYLRPSGPNASETNQKLEIMIPSTSQGDYFAAGYQSKFSMRGDFDVQIDFGLPNWAVNNGVRVGLGTGLQVPSEAVERISFGISDIGLGEVYLTNFSDWIQAITPTADLSGKLRLVRQNNILTGYYFNDANNQWVFLRSATTTTTDTYIFLVAWSHDLNFNDQDILVAYDNFIVNQGNIILSDSSFRPNPDGFQFPNQKLTRDWSMFEQYFGTSNVRKTNGTKCTVAQKFFNKNYRNVAGGWSCLGFSASSLLGYFNWPQPNAGVFAISHYDRLYDEPKSDNLTNTIAYYAGVQTGKQWGDQYYAWLETCDHDSSQMVQSIKNGINNSDPDVVSLNAGKIWHTISPYRVIDISATESDVFVYDSETPGQEQIIKFTNTGGGWQWQYTFRGSLANVGTLSGGCANIFPYRLATSLEQGEPPIDFCQSSTMDFPNNSIDQVGKMWFELPVYGDRFIQNTSGERLGWIENQFVNEIPEAFWVPKALGDFDITSDSFYLPANDYDLMISETISPTISTTIYGDGRAIEMSGELRQPGADVGLQINMALDSAVISGTTNLSSSFIGFTSEIADYSRTVTLMMNMTSGMEPIKTQFGGNSIAISGADNKFQYTFGIGQTGGGHQQFNSPIVSFEPNETHILTPVSWTDLNTSVVILEIDKDSNGTVDKTIEIANLSQKIFLPIVSRQ